jgi:segregation and condensation protein B
MDDISREFPADAGGEQPHGPKSDRLRARDQVLRSRGEPLGDAGPDAAGPDASGHDAGGHDASTADLLAERGMSVIADDPDAKGRGRADGDDARRREGADERSAEPADEEISAAEAAAALAAAEDAIEIDEESVGSAEDGLPPVPELRDADATARIVFVLLLTQRDGLSLLRLAQACNTTQKAVEQALLPLRQWLQQLGLPVELARTADTVKFLSQAETFPFLQRLRGVKKLEKLSPAALETLAVIAYRQPVMRAEIEAIRGVKAGPMLRTLLSHKLARVTGRADVPGRPLQYGTTQQFLDRFGLASLQELPSLKEWKQLG